jgi:hypothetical protein
MTPMPSQAVPLSGPTGTYAAQCLLGSSHARDNFLNNFVKRRHSVPLAPSGREDWGVLPKLSVIFVPKPPRPRR